MTNNPGGIRWQDGTPAYNEQLLNKLFKKEQISELVEYLLESMDMETLESFVRENLTEYYSSEDGQTDFENNYAEMKEINGDE